MRRLRSSLEESYVRLISPAAVVLLLFIHICAPRSTATPTKQPCELPATLQGELTKKYPASHIVTLDDLDEYNRKLFRKFHGSHCPGIARVNFYGDGKRTWAVSLISGENPKRRAELLVARETATGWDIRSLDVTDGTPVVWREPPGAYEGMEMKKIHAKNSVIAYAGLGSWEVIYIWTGEKAEKVQILD